MSSVGIKLLFLKARKVKEAGRMIKPVHVSQGVKNILDLAGFLPGIASEGHAIFDNIQDADAYLESLAQADTLKPDPPRKPLILN